MSVGYLNLIGGASGDMLLGALIDAGLPLEILEERLDSLSVTGYHLSVGKGQRGGINGTQLSVEIAEDNEAAIHWETFSRRIQDSELPLACKSRALNVFSNLEEAERRAHKVSASDPAPHLHELGSLDTLIDVVGVILGLDYLGITKLYSSPLPMGCGTFVSRHGILPSAAPATLELAAMAHFPTELASPRTPMELVTPTGAALITTLAEPNCPTLSLDRIGYGLGSRDPEGLPNVVSIWIGEESFRENSKQELILLETNIDDTNPQLLGYVQEELFALGALDVWFTSIQMKKSRPGVVLSALVPAGLSEISTNLVFAETSTLGIRTRVVQRYEAFRETRILESTLGTTRVKIKFLKGRPIGFVPEFEDCKALAKTNRIPLQDVLRLVEEEARRKFDKIGLVTDGS